jgi:hypothetical protein
MSNVVLKSDLSAIAAVRKAPLGLRRASNKRNQDPQSNPILKKSCHQDGISCDDYNVLDDDDENMNINEKLRAFQTELTVASNVQKSRQAEDDEIVKKRMEQVQEREEKIKAAIAGERIVENNANEDNERVVEAPSALKDNLYSEAYYVRETQRQAKKQAKEEEKKEMKELQEKERKRKGALANLALKMKTNPEKYEEIVRNQNAEATTTQKKETTETEQVQQDEEADGVNFAEVVQFAEENSKNRQRN